MRYNQPSATDCPKGANPIWCTNAEIEVWQAQLSPVLPEHQARHRKVKQTDALKSDGTDDGSIHTPECPDYFEDCQSGHF